MDDPQRLAVVGAGAWGTALALRWTRAGGEVRQWGRDGGKLARIRATRRNEYLPDIPLPESIVLVDGLAECLDGASQVLVVVPSAAFARTLQQMKPFVRAQCRIAWATKGFDPSSGAMLHELVTNALGERPMAVIAGPTFATEVARDLPAAVSLACTDARFGQTLSLGLGGETFRVYPSDDMVGAAVAGAVKNVLAIAAGIADGMALGANTRAALIARGLAEMTRLGSALGAQAETFMGLAGLGDLVLTCTDDQSRNRRFGLALGRGISPIDAEREIGVVEGKSTAAAVMRRAHAAGVEMPITEQVQRVLDGTVSVSIALKALLAREARREF
ncbi:MAG: NAD(P)-dependent glycerol-3-phosphate dehydrogenase [Gammaproteobacteria bacterium]|nr:NAD(P)-dependent glycerol-3-phosphate dehydrogenase [Gammaproteobacteria bacterium]